MLRAGRAETYSRNPNDWILIDVGFSGRQASGSVSRSSGVLLPGDDRARNVTWSDACDLVGACSAGRSSPLNLMLEAPLSIAFDASGNPAARSFERRKAQSRAWYLQGGVVTLFSAALMLIRLAERSQVPIALYEAIISFKTSKTDHAADAQLMRTAATNSNLTPLEADKIRERPTDMLESSLCRFGYDFGIPPVFVIDAPDGGLS
jgi:hypothetical protein